MFIDPCWLPTALQLLELVREEVKGCTDVPRLHAAAGVLCQLASLEEPVRSGALRAALGMLGNRYPKVREGAVWGGPTAPSEPSLGAPVG